jgi:hypothetical protein
VTPRPTSEFLLHLNATRLGFRRLGQNKRDYTVPQLGSDVVLVDPARNPKAPPIRANVIFAVDGLQSLILAEVDLAFDCEDSIFHVHLNIVPIDSWHFKDHR